MGGDGGGGQLFDELGRHGEIFVAVACIIVLIATFMKVVPVGVVGVQTNLVGMAGVELVPLSLYMRPSIAFAVAIGITFISPQCCCCYGPLNAHPEATDAAEELDHADALALGFTT